ncbi:hypothetical protein JCM11251_003111 [Rhodosporidiobolus azoricus]
MDLVPYIYHEKQEPGSMLCGQHALNNLLQTSIFTPQDLADIGRQLDAMEAAQLDAGTSLRGEGGVLNGESQNFDDSGFFSVQVMEEALKVLGHRLVRWGSTEMASMHNTPERIEAFLLNHQLHWFSIRRFATSARFYNLDSCAQQPVWVSAMYLGLTLKEAENQGYSIFAVVPLQESNITGLPPCPAADKALNLPPPHGSDSSSISPHASTSASSHSLYNAFGGSGHSLASPYAASPSSSSARSPFSSALNPSLSSAGSASSSSRKGKRPASVDLSIEEDDDDIIIEEPSGSAGNGSRASSSGSGASGGKRRKMNGVGVGSNGFGTRADSAGAGYGGGGDGGRRGMSEEEEMMARAIRESLNVSGGGGGEGTSSGGATGGQTPVSRAAQSEEDEFERAIRASLAESAGGTGGDGGTIGGSEEVDEDDHVQDDSPTMDELRQRRLARFGA